MSPPPSSARLIQMSLCKSQGKVHKKNSTKSSGIIFSPQFGMPQPFAFTHQQKTNSARAKPTSLPFNLAVCMGHAGAQRQEPGDRGSCSAQRSPATTKRECELLLPACTSSPPPAGPLHAARLAARSLGAHGKHPPGTQHPPSLHPASRGQLSAHTLIPASHTSDRKEQLIHLK